jgi:hypothetical protein
MRSTTCESPRARNGCTGARLPVRALQQSRNRALLVPARGEHRLRQTTPFRKLISRSARAASAYFQRARTAASGSVRAFSLPRPPASTAGRVPDTVTHQRIVALRGAGQTIKRTAELTGCSKSQVKRIWAIHLANLQHADDAGDDRAPSVRR